MNWIRRSVAGGAAALLAGGNIPAFAAGAPPSAYIEPSPDAFDTILRPVAVAQVEGAVTDASALIDGKGATTLSFTAGGKPPMIVLDYGRDVGGLPTVEVTAVAGSPILDEIYAESIKYLLPDGDGAPGFANSPADPTRHDRWVVDAPGEISHRQIQGAERYQAFTLSAPGTIALRLAGIKSLTADPQPTGNTGHFESSDPLLNRIWELGARTMQLCEIPAGSLPPLLRQTTEGLLAQGSPQTIYQYGSNWKDYELSVDAKFLRNEATLVLRSSTFHTLNLTFHGDNDRLGTPGQLDVWESGVFGNSEVATTDLPIDLNPGTWHRILVTLRGNTAIVAIDQKVIGTYHTSSIVGSAGFRADQDRAAVFRNLAVTAPDGSTLYRSSLTTPGTLDQFAAASNQAPVIVDGGKRDRLIWVGDLLLSDPTVFYSSGEDQYVKGALETLGAFHRPDGEISTNNTPTINLAASHATLAPNAAGYFSLPYSIDYVLATYDYLLYSGDQKFVRDHWQILDHEMSYLASHTGPDHLLRTTPADGMDWAIDIQTGEVAEYNALYFGALQDMAAMARILGDNATAAEMTNQADQVNRSFNPTFFNRAHGVYDAGTDHRGSYSQDANVIPIYFGLKPPSGAASVLHRIDAVLDTPNGPKAFSDASGIANVISPFITGFEVNARFALGDDTAALALIRKLWDRMAVPSDYYTGGAFEALGIDGITQMPDRTLAHGWSTAPTAALSEYVLGISPTAPGYATWSIRPQLGDLAWAKGQVATPHGPISVSWDRHSAADRFELNVTIPRGSTGVIFVPVLGSGVVAINGKEVARSEETLLNGHHYLRYNGVPAGHYQFVETSLGGNPGYAG